MQDYSIFKNKIAQGPLFLTFEQPFMFFTIKENSSLGYFVTNFVKLEPDPDPHFQSS